MKISPVIIGSGRSGQAIAKSLHSIGVLDPEFKIAPIRWAKRGDSPETLKAGLENPALFICNPHGLHAKAILDGATAGYRAIVSEKPSCVSLEQLESLRTVSGSVGVLHVYRQMWGMRELRSLIDEGALGEIITVEGRYWQSSTAGRALASGGGTNSWKNDTKLAGESDTFLDLGTHWIDGVSFLLDETPGEITGWRSYINAETPHRDSHVQITLRYASGARAQGSISKAVHGATNHFEVNVLGSKASATWNFLSPDEVLLGEGRDRRVITRKLSELGSHQAPFHGMGWLEGYIEITRQVLREAFLGSSGDYPKLAQNLALMEKVLSARWE